MTMILLAVVMVVVAVVALLNRGQHPTESTGAARPAPHRHADTAAAHLRVTDWVSAGIITAEQAEAIQSFESAGPEPRTAPHTGAVHEREPSTGITSRVPSVAEALGYLGGLLVGIGLALVVSRYWTDLTLAGRLALSGGVAAALLVAGVLVRVDGDPALFRLQSVLWLVSAAATGLAAGVFAYDGLDTRSAEAVALTVALAVVVHSGALWRGGHHPVQEFTFFAAIPVAIGASMILLTGVTPAGVAVWLVAAAILAIGLRTRITAPHLPVFVGTIGVLVGAAMTSDASESASMTFGLVTTAGLLALVCIPGIVEEWVVQVMIAVPAVIAAVQLTPNEIVYFHRKDAVITGLVVWLVGAALLVAGTRQWVRPHVVVEILGAAALIGGAALFAPEWTSFAIVLGLVTALGLLVWGALTDRVLMSVAGAAGLLINVPWGIGWFFPGEGRAPLLIMVTGALFVVLALLITSHHHRHDSHRPNGMLPT
jgi:hypothetical protein